MEPEGSVPCLQEPATGPYQSQTHPVHNIPPYYRKIHFKLSSHPRLGLLSGLFLSGIPTKIL